MYDKEIFSAPGDQAPFRRKGPECASDLVLDRLELGELGGDEADRVRAHLGSCEECRGRATQLHQLAGAFAEGMNLGQLAADALDRCRLAPRRVAPGRLAAWMRRLVPLGVIAGAAAVAAVVVLRREPGGFEPGGLKGGFTLSSYVKHAEQPGPGALFLGEPLHPGDRMQFRYNGSAGYLAIVAVDSRSSISVYYPSGAGQAARVDSGREIALSSAVELDGTLGSERIIAVRCDAPLPIADVVGAARQAMGTAVAQGRPATELGTLNLPCTESRVDISKTSAGSQR